MMSGGAKPGSGATSRSMESTSSGLLRAVQANDPEAWQRLLDLYAPLVYCWCRRAGMRADDAADVLQEVFRAVSQAVGSFRHDRPGDTFRGWLRTIARNKIHDHYRRQGGQPEATGGTDAQQRLMEIAADESETSGGPSLLGGLCRQALELVRAEFEESTWQAFWLSTVDLRPAAETAELLGMTPGAVRQAKYKVLRRLRRELGDVE
jgi:RNA polymerase sigma-70 factor, ECF subfamily